LSEPIVVTQLSLTPVKSTRLLTVERVELEERGARGNRLFHVIDDQSRLVNGKRLGELAKVVAELDRQTNSWRCTSQTRRASAPRFATARC
jgi:uncharacterized protein YcbX